MKRWQCNEYSKFESETHGEHVGVTNASSFSRQTQNWAIVSFPCPDPVSPLAPRQIVSSLPTTVRSSFLTGMQTVVEEFLPPKFSCLNLVFYSSLS